MHWISIKNDEEFWLNKDNRKKYYIECLKKSQRFTLIMCVETHEIFKSRKDLRDHLKVSMKVINKILSNNKEFNGKHYEIIM